MNARLYVIPGSHPSMTARLMLERKGLPYRRTDLLPVISKGVLRALGFPRATVPALALEGRKVQGSREIARALEDVRAEPALFPADPSRRAQVEEAERFGDEVLQPMPRRISWWAFRRDASALAGFTEGARLGVPTGLAVKTSAPIVWAATRFNGADDEAVRADLAALPGVLDRLDAWIRDGTLGGEQPNAADFQVSTSVRLLLCMDDLAPAIDARPAGELARRLVPHYPGRVGRVLPSEWLEPLRG